MTERELLEDMEKELLVDRYGIDYEGVLDYQGFIKMIEEWCRKNDFYMEIDSKKEKVTAKGRNISIGYNLQRKFDNIHFTIIEMDFSVDDMTDSDTEIDGMMKALNKGKVDIIIHSYLMMSIKARWETKGYAYFIRGIIDKFIYKLDKPSFRGVVVTDTYKLIDEIKGYLNIYRHIGEGTPVKGRLKGGWV
ncbi:MAG: hypothetical protein NT001_00300 [Candidatus Woesearchaeota archaeon]|nr:hypothetical protein [Candidatus Woesearchaeota archaeon]